MGTETGYSPVVVSDEGVRVELADDHPGYADPAYRARRDAIASLSTGHRPGDPLPVVEYTDQEHEVWRIVCRELRPKWERYACQAFLDSRERLDLPTDHLPQLSEVTERLVPVTGFRYEPVAGLAPLREFYSSFRDRVFFSTQYVRHHSMPLYTPEPDIVHEVLGHANQLADPTFAAMYGAVGEATARTESDEALAFLSKVFWFTLEFGVLWEQGELRTYGAGILSSYGELDAFRSAEVRSIDFAEMGTATYDITHYQPVLYAADSFDRMVDEVGGLFGEFNDEVAARLTHDRAARDVKQDVKDGSS